ncbi:MAG TPA: hypothetical protein VHR18_01250 [Solirubrobacterales bacterium]|jgi:hypothetical protein|nr:hypothetical protein [Solirubrobacterales bacterium]
MATAGATIGLCFLLAGAVSAAPPTLTATATNAVIGQTVQATAQLSESPGATGTISFEVFGPADPTCTGAAVTPAAATVSGEGEYVSGQFTPPSPGTYHWSAHYSGDLENAAADSVCTATSTVSKAAPSIGGDASDGTVGTAIHDEATLSGGASPSGEVTFSVFAPADSTCATPLATTTAPIIAGKATSADFIPQQAGGFRWTATYPGDANNDPIATTCGAATQTSVVAKAAPSLSGIATSAPEAGQPIDDTATLAGGFTPGGALTFRAYGPGDETCATAPKYEATVAVTGNGDYSPAGFAPLPGLYRWTVSYDGDANNLPAGTLCDAPLQSSAVGLISATLAAEAGNGAVGTPIQATATIQKGAIPSGQLVFKAFPPADPNCTGNPSFSSTIAVSGNGKYSSAAFVPTRVGAYRWTVAYSGDANHTPAEKACGAATSNVAKAAPSITSAMRQRLAVGTRVRDIATLLGGYLPSGTITFRIYAPGTTTCDKPAFLNTVAITGNGSFASDPFVPSRPGLYRFVASYSGDATNQAAVEPCGLGNQEVRVTKRKARVSPRAALAGRRISIRARLAGAASPSGVVNFRLYRPGDSRCQRRPAFSGGVTVTANGTVTLAEYLATKPGIYRLRVGYSGDPRNKPYEGSCASAQPIRAR